MPCSQDTSLYSVRMSTNLFYDRNLQSDFWVNLNFHHESPPLVTLYSHPGLSVVHLSTADAATPTLPTRVGDRRFCSVTSCIAQRWHVQQEVISLHGYLLAFCAVAWFR